MTHSSHHTDVSKDDFLALLSHELRTPLNSIMGMLQLALHSRSRDSIQEYLTVALESSKHMLLLLGDISEIASSEDTRQTKPESFDLESLISPVISSFSTSAGGKGLEVSCQIDPKLPKYLWGDPGHTRQILFNLLTHAVKQAYRGKISVLLNPLAEHDSLKRNGLHILVKIADTGKVEKSPES